MKILSLQEMLILAIYNFKLNADRTELLLRGALEDKIGDTHHELQLVIFGQVYV